MNFRPLKVLAFAVISLLTALPAFAGQCRSDTPDLLDEIKKRGELRVGYVQSKPYQYTNLDTGELEGVVVEAAKMLADEFLKVKLTWVEAKWDTMIAGLQANKYDIIMSNTGRGLGRAESVWFTKPWLMGFQAFLVRKSDNIRTRADLDKEGNTIVVMAGERAHQVYTQQSPDFFKNAKIKALVPPALPEQDVASGRAVAYAAGMVDTQMLAKANSDWAESVTLPETPRANGAGFIVPQCQHNMLHYMDIYLDVLIEGKYLYDWGRKYGLPVEAIVAPRPTFGDLANSAQ